MLFSHCVQVVLRHGVGDDTPTDDFSAWVYGVVQDRETAERLSFAVQHRAGSCAELRDALVQVLLSVPEKARLQRAAPDEGDFVFLEMDSVAVETGRYASDSVELIPAGRTGSVSIGSQRLRCTSGSEACRSSVTSFASLPMPDQDTSFPPLVSLAAYDLRTPLATIYGFARTIQRANAIEPSLAILDGLHARWVTVLRALAPQDFTLPLYHPEIGAITVDYLVQTYGWHSRHHVAHITRLREREGW